MTTVIVDWLGRGGIAQTSRAWTAVLSASGAGGGEVVVVTRTGRELRPSTGVDVTGVESGAHAVVTHGRLVRQAARVIRDVRPEAVVVQNYVIPALEWAVLAAARRVGARLVMVVHDHRLPLGTDGTRLGLRRLISGADVVVCHSEHVARGVRTLVPRDIEVLPLPWPAVSDEEGLPGALLDHSDGHSLALHFGLLNKAYKGTDTIRLLASIGVPKWRFALLGPGAPADVPGAMSVPGFLDHESLLASVAASDATLLPYSQATQSGAVPLAQACGSVVVASAVGGIPEQVDDGATGLLVRPGAGPEDWALALERLSDPGVRAGLARNAKAALAAGQDEFCRRAVGLVV